MNDAETEAVAWITVKLAEEKDKVAALLAACKAALDPDPCRLDHHGNCQAHWLGNPCHNKLLREAIAKAETPKGDS